MRVLHGMRSSTRCVLPILSPLRVQRRRTLFRHWDRAGLDQSSLTGKMIADDRQSMGHDPGTAQHRPLQTYQSRGAVLQSQGWRAAEYHQYKQHERGQRQRVSRAPRLSVDQNKYADGPQRPSQLRTRKGWRCRTVKGHCEGR